MLNDAHFVSFFAMVAAESSHGNTSPISTALLAHRIAVLLPMCRAEAQRVVRRNVGAGTIGAESFKGSAPL